jgi:hypothetical protein
MTFKLKPNPTFERAVKIPAPDGEQVLVMVFKHKRRDELKAYFERAAQADVADATAILEIVDGWKDADVPFSPEAVADLVQNYYGAVPAIFDAYVAGLMQAKEKN